MIWSAADLEEREEGILDTCLCRGGMCIPLLPLHLVEHCRGARQDAEGSRALMLFPSMGIRVFQHSSIGPPHPLL